MIDSVRRRLTTANTWSLDAALVAVTWQAGLTWHWTGRAVTLWETLTIAAATWSVYASDHAADAARPASEIPRHRLYRRRRATTRGLRAAVAVAVGAALLGVFPIRLAVDSIVLAGIVLGYLILRRKRWIGRPTTKAAAVAGLFAAGMHLIPWSTSVNATAGMLTSWWWSTLPIYVNCRLVQHLHPGRRTGPGPVDGGWGMAWLCVAIVWPSPSIAVAAVVVLALGLMMVVTAWRSIRDRPTIHSDATAAVYDGCLVAAAAGWIVG